VKFVSSKERLEAAAIKRPPSGASHPNSYQNLVYGTEHDTWKMPKANYQYFDLKCGHETTPETQWGYAIWKPRPDTYFCEKGCGWVGKTPPKPPYIYPEDPRMLF
jgi:hypothetical protein